MQQPGQPARRARCRRAAVLGRRSSGHRDDRSRPGQDAGRRDAASSADVAPAAAGSARTTSRRTGRQRVQPAGQHGPQAALDLAADDGVARRPWTRRSRRAPGWASARVVLAGSCPGHAGPDSASCTEPGSRCATRWLLPARRPRRTARAKSSRRRIRCAAGSMPAASGRELAAALAATSGQDRATRTRAHAQAEAVGLGPTAVVRLERTLAHEFLLQSLVRPPGKRGVGHHRTPARARPDQATVRTWTTDVTRCAGMRQRPPRGGPLQGTAHGRREGQTSAPAHPARSKRDQPLSLSDFAAERSVRHADSAAATDGARVPFPSQAPGTPYRHPLSTTCG